MAELELLAAPAPARLVPSDLLVGGLVARLGRRRRRFGGAVPRRLGIGGRAWRLAGLAPARLAARRRSLERGEVGASQPRALPGHRYPLIGEQLAGESDGPGHRVVGRL